jgi:hypothetical protein
LTAPEPPNWLTAPVSARHALLVSLPVIACVEITETRSALLPPQRSEGIVLFLQFGGVTNPTNRAFPSRYARRGTRQLTGDSGDKRPVSCFCLRRLAPAC